jgi:hypothetical protein
MDYRIFLAAPLAAVALTANSADGLRLPEGWNSSASYAPQGNTHEAGVAPETETSGERALTVRALGQQQPNEIGSISQTLFGYAGRRVRLSGQVKTAGVDGWAGLVINKSYVPLAQSIFEDAYASRPALGSAGCPEWCEVSVVADVGNDVNLVGMNVGSINVGLALVGNGQAWARKLQVETVGTDVPLTTEVFAAKAAEAAQALMQQYQQLRAAQKTPPRNLALR